MEMLFELFVATMAVNFKTLVFKPFAQFGSRKSVFFSLRGLSEWCGLEEKPFPL
jgi:hypothetical protein